MNSGLLMSSCNPVHPAKALGENISHTPHDRIPISNELTSNLVNPGPLMSKIPHRRGVRVRGTEFCRHPSTETNLIWIT